MIQYRTDKNFEAEQLKELFSSVNWLSANYSERLVKALYNSSTVISAWDGEWITYRQLYLRHRELILL